MWKLKLDRKVKLKNVILIEGLPGIGNVGKIAVDFLVDELKAKRVGEFLSDKLPHTTYVNEQSLIEMPKIELFYLNFKKQDYLFIAGDFQPLTEQSCHEFCSCIVNSIKELKSIVILGGIGLQETSKIPKVYVTGNTKEAVSNFKGNLRVYTTVYGVVGPIIGVSGILPIKAKEKKIPCAVLLAETIANQMFLGIKGSKELVNILNKKYSFSADIKKLDREIKQIDKELLSLSMPQEEKSDTRYIG